MKDPGTGRLHGGLGFQPLRSRAVIVNLGTNDSGVFCDKEELREGMKALLGYDPPL